MTDNGWMAGKTGWQNNFECGRSGLTGRLDPGSKEDSPVSRVKDCGWQTEYERLVRQIKQEERRSGKRAGGSPETIRTDCGLAD